MGRIRKCRECESGSSMAWFAAANCTEGMALKGREKHEWVYVWRDAKDCTAILFLAFSDSLLVGMAASFAEK